MSSDGERPAKARDANTTSPAQRLANFEDGKDIKAMLKELVKEVESESSAQFAYQSTISKTPPQQTSMKLESTGKLGAFEIGVSH